MQVQQQLVGQQILVVAAVDQISGCGAGQGGGSGVVIIRYKYQN